MITSLATKRISAILPNISESFTHKMPAKASWHRNYVTVTLCIAEAAMSNENEGRNMGCRPVSRPRRETRHARQICWTRAVEDTARDAAKSEPVRRQLQSNPPDCVRGILTALRLLALAAFAQPIKMLGLLSQSTTGSC